MKKINLAFLFIIGLSSIASASRIPPVVYCKSKDIAVVLRDFTYAQKQGVNISYANLILTRGNTQSIIKMGGVGATINVPMFQMVSEDKNTAIQVITLTTGKKIANFSSKDAGIELQGEKALPCKDYRR